MFLCSMILIFISNIFQCLSLLCSSDFSIYALLFYILYYLRSISLLSLFLYSIFNALFGLFPIPLTIFNYCRNCGEFSYWNRIDYVVALTYCGSNCVNSSKFALYSHASVAPGEISTCFLLLFPFLAFLFLFFLISLKRFMTAKDTVENSNVCAYSSFNAHKGSKGRGVRVVKRRPERHKVKLQPKQIGGCCCLRLFTCSALLKCCAHFLLPTLRRSRKR